jgi:hypothetical protein
MHDAPEHVDLYCHVATYTSRRIILWTPNIIWSEWTSWHQRFLLHSDVNIDMIVLRQSAKSNVHLRQRDYEDEHIVDKLSTEQLM